MHSMSDNIKIMINDKADEVIERGRSQSLLSRHQIWLEVGICHAIYRYVKADNKYMKDYDKKNYCHILITGM